MSYDDPFANLESDKEQEEGKRKRQGDKKKARPTKKEALEQPLSVSRREVYKATGSGSSAFHGKYYQLTTRLRPDLVDEIKAWAEELNMTQQDVQRWCFYRGLDALADGERPEFEDVIVKKKLKRPD